MEYNDTLVHKRCKLIEDQVKDNMRMLLELQSLYGEVDNLKMYKVDKVDFQQFETKCNSLYTSKKVFQGLEH